MKKYSFIFFILLFFSAAFYRLFSNEVLKEVRGVRIGRGNISEDVTATGRVESVRETIIRTKLEGMIKEVFVEEGDRIQKGAVLAVYDSDFYQNRFGKAKIALREAELRLADARKKAGTSDRIKFDPQEYGLSLKQRETERETALINFRTSKREYEMFQDLSRSGIVSKRELDGKIDAFKRAKTILEQAEKNFEDAKSLFEKREKTDLNIHSMETEERKLELEQEKAGVDVQYWRSQIEKLKVIAPHNGVVINKIAENGMLLNAGMEIVTIADVENLRILAEVDEIDAGKILLKMPAAVTFDAFPGEVFRAEVVDISPRAVKKSERTIVEVKLKLLRSNYRLKINNQVNVKIILRSRTGVLMVPLESLVQDGDSYFVWTVKENRLKRLALKTGISDFSMIEVIDGIHEGVPVVSHPEKSFVENAPAKITVAE